MTAKGKPGFPHPRDVAMGARIKTCREDAQMTQKTFALELGVSFQQVQKYENGTTRVGYSRLTEMAEVLNLTTIALIAPIGGDKESVANNAEYMSLLRDPTTRSLFDAIKRLRSKKAERALLAFVLSISDSGTGN